MSARRPTASLATVIIPSGQRLVVCLDCGDELRTASSELAALFREWHRKEHGDTREGDP